VLQKIKPLLSNSTQEEASLLSTYQQQQPYTRSLSERVSSVVVVVSFVGMLWPLVFATVSNFMPV